MGNLSNTSGLIAEEYFIRWHEQIMSYSGHQENVTVLKDVRKNIAFTKPADIDFIITGQDETKLAFHECKYFKYASERGNIYFEEIKDLATCDFKTVLTWTKEQGKKDIAEDKKTDEAQKKIDLENMRYLPDTLEYIHGAGWIYKNRAFHPDFYHFGIPCCGEPVTCSQPKKQAFLETHTLPVDQNTGKTVKLITEAPTGIWISMEHNAATSLYQLAKADEEYAQAHGKTNRYKGSWQPLNFSTSLVMKVREIPAFVTIDQPFPTADGQPLTAIIPNLRNVVQIRPVVKCITPDNPDNEITEVMETAVTDYYIPTELLEKCREPEAYKLYNKNKLSQYDCRKLAEEMQAELIKALEQAQPL